MAQKVPTVHRNFADWYRVTGLDPADMPVELRWRAVYRWATTKSMDDLSEYVRVAHSKKPVRSQLITELEDGIRAHDPTASLASSDFELSVLVASALLVTLESRSVEADFVALAVSSATFLGWSPVLAQLPAIASAYLEAEAVRVRQLDEVELPQGTNEKLKSALDAFRALFPEATVPGSTPVTFEQLTPLVAALTEEVVTTSAGLRNSSTALSQNLRATQEEADVLWWLEVPATDENDLPGVLTPFAIASDLARRTRLLPTLPGVENLLCEGMRRRGIPDSGRTPVPIGEAIESSGRELLARLTSSRSPAIGDLCPLLTAAQRAEEVPAGTPWVEAASAVIGIDLAAPQLLHLLTVQLYRELMLVRSFSV